MAGQQSITTNLRPLSTDIYHVMIIKTGGFSRNLFYYYFLEILLNDLEFVFLKFKLFYKTHWTSLFSFYLFIFYLLFTLFAQILQLLCILTLSTFSHHHKQYKREN